MISISIRIFPKTAPAYGRYDKKGIEQNLKGMCFTEHTDLDFPGDTFTFLTDLDAYEKTFLQLKEKYQSQINLYFGLEVGLQPHLKKEIPALCTSKKF